MTNYVHAVSRNRADLITIRGTGLPTDLQKYVGGSRHLTRTDGIDCKINPNVVILKILGR